MAKINAVVPSVLGGAVLVGGGYLYLQQNGQLEELKTKLASMGGTFNGGGGGVSYPDLSFLSDVFANLPNGSSGFSLQDALNKLTSPVTTTLTSVTDATKNLIDGAQTKIDETLDGLRADASALNKALDDKLKALADLPKNAVNGVKGALTPPNIAPNVNVLGSGLQGAGIGAVLGGIIAAFTGVIASPIIGSAVAGAGSAVTGSFLRQNTIDKTGRTPEQNIKAFFVGDNQSGVYYDSSGSKQSYNPVNGLFGVAGSRKPAGSGSSGYSAPPVSQGKAVILTSSADKTAQQQQSAWTIKDAFKTGSLRPVSVA